MSHHTSPIRWGKGPKTTLVTGHDVYVGMLFPTMKLLGSLMYHPNGSPSTLRELRRLAEEGGVGFLSMDPARNGDHISLLLGGAGGKEIGVIAVKHTDGKVEIHRDAIPVIKTAVVIGEEPGDKIGGMELRNPVLSGKKGYFEAEKGLNFWKPDNAA